MELTMHPFSTTSARSPAFLASMAQAKPVGPAPTISKSKSAPSMDLIVVLMQHHSMFPAAALLALLWIPQTAVQAPAHKTAHTKAAALEKDQISLALNGNDITLHGTVHVAEHKGLATVAARKVAEKDGWADFHVLNQLAVELPRS